MDLSDLGLDEETLLKLAARERQKREAKAAQEIGIQQLVGRAVWCGQNVGIVLSRIPKDDSITLGTELFKTDKGRVQWSREVNALWTTVSLLADAVPAAPRLHPETPAGLVMKHEKRWADQYALARLWEEQTHSSGRAEGSDAGAKQGDARGGSDS